MIWAITSLSQMLKFYMLNLLKRLKDVKQIDIVFLECDFKLPMISEYPVNQHIKIC